MKKTITALLFCLFSNIFAQAPQGMTYQSVIRNSKNALVANAPVSIKISILKGSQTGAPVYIETHSPSTNDNGLANIIIGTGSPLAGTFSTINWGNDQYYIKTETDPNGGVNYNITGTSKLMSVPYALHAANVVNYSSGPGISVNNGIITNMNPDQPVSIMGTGNTAVSGTYPNFTINTPAYTCSTGVSLVGNTIVNTAPDKIVNLSPAGGASITGTYPNYTVSAPAQQVVPQVNISAAGSATVSGAYPNYTVASPVHPAVNIAGSGNTTVQGSFPNYTVSTPAPQSVNITQGPGVSVIGSFPNYTVASTAPRSIYGTNTAGFTPSMLIGGGFTVNRLTTGIYTVTFNTAFSSIPSVIASVYCNNVVDGYNNVTYFCKVYNQTTSGFYIHLFNGGGDVDNIGFSIIATGN